MSVGTINEGRFAVENNPAKIPSLNILIILAAVPAQFRNARSVARQARQLYAMSDAALAEIGLNREAIPTRLLESYTQ